MSQKSAVRARVGAIGVEFHAKKLKNVLMPEWSKGPDSSSGVATRVGSNPTQDSPECKKLYSKIICMEETPISKLGISNLLL